MADVKISELTSATSFTGAELVEVVQGGNNKKATVSQFTEGLLESDSNLSDLASAATARTNLGLGTLATQNGTFSGTSSGTNTGDQTLNSLLPTQTGNNGKVLQTDGTNSSWETPSGSSTDATDSVKGIAKLYTSLGTNTDGSVDQNTINTAFAGKSDSIISYRTKTAAYTLTATDRTDILAGRTLNFLMDVTIAHNFTVPDNATIAFPIGTQFLIDDIGVGQTTIIGSGSTIIQGADGNKISARYQGASLKKIDTNTWLLQGSTTL